MAHSSSPLACSLYKLRCVISICKLREWKQVIYLDYWSNQIPPAQHFIHMLIGQVHLQSNCHASLLLCTFSLDFPSILYVQSSGQVILRTQLLSKRACNHMNVKKGIQLLLLLAIHHHTTESVQSVYLHQMEVFLEYLELYSALATVNICLQKARRNIFGECTSYI